MVRIYRIDQGDPDYLWINPSSDVHVREIHKCAYGEGDLDKSMTVQIETGGSVKKKDWIETDMPYLACGGAFLFSERAVNILGTELQKSGFFLKTHSPQLDTKYYLWVSQLEIDALDQNKSKFTRFKDGGIWDMMRYELIEGVISEHNVFRLKGLRGRYFITDTIVDLVKKNQLTGFIYEEIWSTETGGFEFRREPLGSQAVGEEARRAKAKRKALRAEAASRAENS